MSTLTMPANDKNSFKCEHCGFDTNKPPCKKYKGEQLHTLFFCGQCRELTLIRFDPIDPINGVCSIFKVQS